MPKLVAETAVCMWNDADDIGQRSQQTATAVVQLVRTPRGCVWLCVVHLDDTTAGGVHVSLPC